MNGIKDEWTTECGSIRLLLGDCLEILPGLGKVDAVVTDIPYGEVNRESSGLRSLDKGIADVVEFDLLELTEYIARACVSAYVFCGIEQVSQIRAGFVAAEKTTRLCIWEKTNPSPMNGDRLWLSSVECCVFARGPHAYFSEHCASPVWRGPVQKDQQHPTQKPVWLMERLISASVMPGGIAADPFMGSGTTGLACIRLGRRFVGIEKEPKYFEIAKRRIRDELDKTRLIEKPKRLVQKSFVE